MINMNYMRTLGQELKTDKKLEKSSTVNEKSDKSFKEVLEVKSKVNSKEGNQVENKTLQNNTMYTKESKTMDIEPKEVAKEIVDKLASLTDKLDAGADEEVILDELLALLAMLNINTAEVKTLPIEIKLDATNIVDVELNTNNKLIDLLEVDNFNGEASILNSFVKDNSLAELSELILKVLSEDNNITAPKNMEALSQLNELILKPELSEGNTIAPKDIKALEEQILKLLPLIKTEDGNEVSKEDIVLAIKNKLINTTNNNTDGISNNLLKVEEVKVVNKDIIPTMVTVKEKVEVTENKLAVPSETLTEEDKVLSKLLSDDTKDFSSLLSRFEAKNNITNTTSTEGTPVFKETMDKDVIKNIKFMVRNAVQELKVKIYPKELGELTIKILSEEGIMRAEIKATSKETYNLLNSNMNEIKKALSNENIKIQEVNIGLYSEDTTYFSGQGFDGTTKDNKEQGKNSTMVINDEGEEIIEESTNASNVDFLA